VKSDWYFKDMIKKIKKAIKDSVKNTKLFDRYKLRKATAWRRNVEKRRKSNSLPVPRPVGETELDAIWNGLKNSVEQELQVGEDDSNLVSFCKCHMQFSKVVAFEKEHRFRENMNRHHDRYYFQVMMYYFTHKLLRLDEQRSEFIYIDCCSGGSMWSKLIHDKYGINSWSIDLREPYYKHERFIQGDVTKLPFEDSSVDALSMQTALEVLPEDIDIKFIEEATRVLKWGGKLVISPLYMNTVYSNVFGWTHYDGTVAEDDAEKFIRVDYDEPFNRLYDAPHLMKRVIDPAIRGGVA